MSPSGLSIGREALFLRNRARRASPECKPVAGDVCRNLAQAGRRLAFLLGAVGVAALPRLAIAEEGGSGHYLPGSIASFVDGVPPTETVLVRFNGLGYIGSTSATQRLPFAGVAVVAPKADVWGAGLTVLWRPPVEPGGRWSYAMSATIPFVASDVSASVNATFVNAGSGSIARSSTTYGLGDIVLMPLMLNYKLSPDLNASFRAAFYAPTGDYEVGRLSNTGKNFWTVEPTLGLVYLSQKNGLEVSVYIGSDFNTENSTTHYTSGTQFHVDGTLAQHFPWLDGLCGVGISAYDYQQVTGDTGTGVNFGSFKAKTTGLGPVFSYVGKIGTQDTLWEFKWLHEVQAQNRLQGDILWLKAVYKF